MSAHTWLLLAPAGEDTAPVVAAELHVTDQDWPWLIARVVRHPAFEQVADLFAEELRLVDGINDGVDAWEAAYTRIRAATRLQDPDGTNVPEYLLHIDGAGAWWRFHDTPFEESDS